MSPAAEISGCLVAKTAKPYAFARKIQSLAALCRGNTSSHPANWVPTLDLANPTKRPHPTKTKNALSI